MHFIEHKSFIFCFKFPWNMFLWVQLTKVSIVIMILMMERPFLPLFTNMLYKIASWTSNYIPLYFNKFNYLPIPLSKQWWTGNCKDWMVRNSYTYKDCLHIEDSLCRYRNFWPSYLYSSQFQWFSQPHMWEVGFGKLLLPNFKWFLKEVPECK